MMIRNEEAAVVRNQVQKVLAAWSPLRGQVGQLAPIDREHLDKLRQQLQPLLVDLQATFSL